MTSVADFSDDDWLRSTVSFDESAGALVLKLHAKRAIRLVEVQGFTKDIEAFGLSMPEGFRKMLFGEGVNIPEEMRLDIEVMNQANFRWGCDYPIKARSDLEIRLPATGPGKDRVVLTLTYEYPRLFGLLRGKNGFYARMLPESA